MQLFQQLYGLSNYIYNNNLVELFKYLFFYKINIFNGKGTAKYNKRIGFMEIKIIP